MSLEHRTPPDFEELRPVVIHRSNARLIKYLLFVFAAALIIFGVFVATPWYMKERIVQQLAAAHSVAEQGPVEDAIPMYERAISNAPKSSALPADIEEVKRQLELYSRNAEQLKNKADADLKNERFLEALTLYREVWDKYPLSRYGVLAKAEIDGVIPMACQQQKSFAEAAAASRRWYDAKASWQSILNVDARYAGAADGLAAANKQIAEYDHELALAKSAADAEKWQEAFDHYVIARGILPASAAAYDGRAKALPHLPRPAGMVLIEPGDFIAGPGIGRPQQATVHTDGYYIDVKEVTVEQYGEFLKATGRSPLALRPECMPQPMSDLPVYCVSWDDAAAYAEWAGKRLPTADEWERAARGKKGNVYPWGNEFVGNEGNFWYCPMPVGSAKMDCSEDGCLDMAGNVAEWTSDKASKPKFWPDPDTRSGYFRGEEWWHHLEYRVVKGDSWAGFESDRPSTPHLACVAQVINTNPLDIIAVRKRGAYGATCTANAMTSFVFRGIGPKSATFEIRMWVDKVEKFVFINAGIKEGEWIAARRMVPLSSDEAPMMQLNARWKFIEITPDGEYATCENSTGLRANFARYTVPMTNNTFMAQSLERTWRDTLFDNLQAQSLANNARASECFILPQSAKYANVGFRCVKDIP